MYKIIRLALACSALITALTFTPQTAQASCSGAVLILPTDSDERTCQKECRIEGCSYYYLDPVWYICYCS